MKIADVLARKASPRVVTVDPESSVADLVGVLGEHGIGACVVSRNGARVEGMVSERDVVRRLAQDTSVLSLDVAAIMTASVTTCDAEDTLDDVLAVMTERRVRHVPVVDAGGLVGIVSIGDLVKHRIEQLTFERDQLEGYVHQT